MSRNPLLVLGAGGPKKVSPDDAPSTPPPMDDPGFSPAPPPARATEKSAARAPDRPAARVPTPPGLPPSTVVTDAPAPPGEGEGWWTRRELWGLPNWQVTTGAGLLGGLAYFLGGRLLRAVRS